MIKLKLFSIDVYISFWIFVFLAYTTVSSVSGQRVLLICLFCTVVHEAGHIIMICKFRGRPERIVLKPFEFKIYADLSELTVSQDVLITCFGVVANLILGLFAYMFYLLFCYEVLLIICLASLAIGFINILPVESFDGGQLLRIFLVHFLSEKLSSIVSFVVSVLFVIPIAYFGIGVLFVSKYNFSLLFIAIYILSIYFKRNCGDSID